ncbi:MAG: amidohydrolase [Xanthobacteraceae bacterium]|nr:amidohydrolase [Xanthobacteraceae bacterium]
MPPAPETAAESRTIDKIALPGRDGVFSLTLRDGIVSALTPSHGDAAWLALPSFANLHAHADRAFTVASFRPRNFADAVAAAATARAHFTADDVRTRATRLLEKSVAHGVARMRTHTDVDPIVEMRSIQGVLEARAAMTGRIDVDVIAFSTSRNDLADPNAVARLRDAIAHGPQFLGASLNSSVEPRRALDALLDLAERHDLPIDLHLDEHLEPAQSLAGLVADAAIARGLQGRVTMSHLCVLSALPPDAASTLIARLAEAEVTVIALPETNLYLQDRRSGTPLRRGVTLVHELLAAGVTVRFGTDNVRDWFFPFGDGDMLATAQSVTIAAQLDDDAALIAGLCDGRGAIEAGTPADLVLVPADSLDDALARLPAGRLVFKQGRQVAGLAHLKS